MVVKKEKKVFFYHYCSKVLFFSNFRARPKFDWSFITLQFFVERDLSVERKTTKMWHMVVVIFQIFFAKLKNDVTIFI